MNVELNDSNIFKKDFAVTDREQEIIILLVKGYSYNEIGKNLFISYQTVKTHVYNIYKKIDVKNKIELMNLYISRTEITD